MNFTQHIKTLLLALVLSIGISYAYATWSDPTATPPGNNASAPINISTAPQVKSGPLGVDDVFQTYKDTFLAVTSGNVGIGMTSPAEKLDVAGNIKASGNIQAPTVCISGDCKSAWPVGGGGTITGVTAGTGLTGGGTTGNVTLNADTNVLQQRVAGTCPTGAINTISPSGNVTCQQNIVKHAGSDYCGGTGFMGFSATGGLVFPTTGLAWCPGYGGWRSDGCDAPDPQLAIVWVLCTQ